MAEPQIRIQLTIAQTQVLNRGIGDVMRSTSLLPSGEVVLDYEQYGTHWNGTIIGDWVLV